MEDEDRYEEEPENEEINEEGDGGGPLAVKITHHLLIRRLSGVSA